ncbi:MAG: helix-turn-helix transcriptional regulator [Chloroflexota bacterium]|nr:helix-turn-helix transcriptional regulator [Chloroflexota bacterium]
MATGGRKRLGGARPRQPVPPELLQAFGDTVRSLRLRAGLSQEELARRAGLHFTYVSSVERGERNISLRNIHALASALGVAVSELFRSDDAAIDLSGEPAAGLLSERPERLRRVAEQRAELQLPGDTEK